MTARRLAPVVGLSLVLTLLGSAGAARAQASRPADVRTYGPPLSMVVVDALAFVASDAAQFALFQPEFAQARSCTGTCLIHAPLSLPEGALVTSIQLEACDSTSTGRVIAALERAQSPQAANFVLTTAETDPDNSLLPGCGFFSGVVNPPHTIDNAHNRYRVTVGLSGGTSNTRFQAVRVFYQLQVSPPPGVATFADVPTDHPFFPFIEALVAAGITSGCSVAPPLYCPDSHLTRGQAAVFFGRALGLQFAP